MICTLAELEQVHGSRSYTYLTMAKQPLGTASASVPITAAGAEIRRCAASFGESRQQEHEAAADQGQFGHRANLPICYSDRRPLRSRI